MRPTRKTIFITFGIAIVLPVTLLIGFSWLVFFCLNLLLLFCVLCDGLLTKTHLRFTIERMPVDKFQRSQPGQMNFQIINEGAYVLDFKGVERLIPFAFEGDFKGFQGQLEPSHQAIFGYQMTPLKRGDFEFTQVKIQFKSVLGFLTIERLFRLPCRLKVYPNLKALNDFSWQRLQNRRYLDAVKRLRLRSTGQAFESLREYYPGDDYRAINWQATARSGHPVVNQFQMENNQRIYMMLDCGRSMSYTIRGNRQLDVAIETAVILAHRIHESGDQFGFTAFDQKIQVHLNCSKGLEHRQRLVESVYNLQPSILSAHYGNAFLKTMEKERHRSIVMVMTDFDTVKDVDRFLAQIAYGLKRHVFVVLLMTRSELEDVANEPFTEGRIFEKSAAMQLVAERDAIQKRLKRHGVLAVVCPPEELATEAIQQYLLAKAKMQGL